MRISDWSSDVCSSDLNEPIAVQFFGWIGRLVRGDLGISIFSNLPVTTLIAQRLEPTLMLSLVTILFSVLVAVPLGAVAAWRAGSWIDRAVIVFAVLGFSIPVFVLAYFLVYGFSLHLKWLPVQGYRSPADGFWPLLHHLTPPADWQ